MCELLGLSSSRPARLTFSLRSLASHGGMGGVALANTQPFVRELGGRTHVFAHNGDLPGIWQNTALAIGPHHPVGETDSERAFCALLARLRMLSADEPLPPLSARLALLELFAAELRALGPANFLYADADVLFAHGHRRIRLATGRVEAPGLWILQRHCADDEASTGHTGGVAMAQEGQSIVMIASVPLTNDAWRSLSDGEIVVVRDGMVITVPPENSSRTRIVDVSRH